MTLFRYPGGKSKLSKPILCELNKHSSTEYREPFFGGGSIGIKFLEGNNNIQKVWINDKDPAICVLWHSVINEPEYLKSKVLNFIPTTESFYQFKHDLLHNESNHIDHGFKKLVIHQISYSGLGVKSGGPLGGKNQKSKYKIDCRWSPKHICKEIDKLNKLFSRFDVTCTCKDFEELICAPGDALLYLDPPYYIKGGDLYQFSFSTADHKKLSKLLNSTSHKWVLSYDSHPDVYKMYECSRIETVNANYSITTSRVKEELLIAPYGNYRTLHAFKT